MRADDAAGGVLAGVGKQIGMGMGGECTELPDLLGVVVLGVGAQGAVELGECGGGWGVVGFVP